MPTFPEFDPTTLYSKDTARYHQVGRSFHKRDTLRLKKQIDALLSAPLGGPVYAAVRQVQAVQQPPSSTTQGAAGANGGIIPITTLVLADDVTTYAMANSVVAMLLRDNTRYQSEYARGGERPDESVRGDRARDQGVGEHLDSVFTLDHSRLA